MNQCLLNTARVYAQYRCLETSENLLEKRKIGLFISCFFIFVAMFFWVINYYMSVTQDLDFKVWDVNSVTVGDFTVYWNISPDQWRFYRENISKDAEDERSDIEKFTAWLTNEMETRVNSVPHVVTPGTDLKVARINYMFDNMQLIRTLDKRGNLITAGVVEDSPCCSDKVFDPISIINEECETQIVADENKANKDKRFAYTTPVACYITFETQEAFERAVLYWDKNLDILEI